MTPGTFTTRLAIGATGLAVIAFVVIPVGRMIVAAAS